MGGGGGKSDFEYIYIYYQIDPYRIFLQDIDNIFDRFIQLACIRYKNQNAVAHGCRDFVTILRQPQF